MYVLRVDSKKDDGKKDKEVKGVKSNVVARTITFEDYTRYDEIEMTQKVYKIKITQGIYSVRDKDCSKSIQQAICRV